MLEMFPDRGPIRFNKLRDAGSVINATVVFLRQNARELLVGYIALVAPFAIIAGIATALYFRRFGALFSDPTALESDPLLVLDLFGPSYFVLLLGGVLAFGVGQAAVSAYVRLYREGEVGNISVSYLWDESKGLILPVIGMYVLYMLIALLSGIVAIIPCLGALVWFGFLVWSMPYAHVVFASRMTESSSIVEAYQRARYLVKGSWGFAFGSLFLSWVLTAVAVMAIAIPVSVILSLVFTNSVSASADPTAALNAAAYTNVPIQIVSMVAYIIPALAAFFVHGRLVEDADGAGLEDELDIFDAGIEAAPNSSWDRPEPGRGEPDAPSGDETIVDPDETLPPDDGNTGGFRGGRFGS